MRITVEQEKILESFRCERLSSNEINTMLIRSFVSKRGSSLVSYFKQHGLKEDMEGTTTYYIIKTKDDEVLMFFSLKCGALFDPLRDEDEVEQDIQRLMILLQAVENASGDGSEAEEANAILTKFQVGDRISVEDFHKLLCRKAQNKKKFIETLSGDKEKRGFL